MPNEYDALFAPTDPRDRVHRIASASNISPDIADDYLRLTKIESGHNVNVRDSSKGAKGFGQVMPDVRGGSTRTVGGRRYNLKDPSQNIEAGLRYFNEGGSDPVGRRLHYFGGPKARRTYERTGRIPNISDGNMTATQYVKATGGQQQSGNPYDALFGPSAEKSNVSRETPPVTTALDALTAGVNRSTRKLERQARHKLDYGQMRRNEYAPDLTLAEAEEPLRRAPIGFSRSGQPSRITQTSDELRVMKGEQPTDRQAYSRQQDAQARLSQQRDESYRERQAREARDAQWRAANEAEIDRQTAIYRQDIQKAKRTGGDPNKWIAEFGTKAAGQLLEFGGGLGSDALKVHAEAALRAAEEEGADRSQVSKGLQNIGAGFLGTLPELAAMRLGISPVAAFAGGSAIRAGARTSDPMEVTAAAEHGAATGLGFEVPGVGRGLTRPATKAGGVGATTAAIEYAGGASPQEALTTGATNALVTLPGSLGGLRNGREAETQRRGLQEEQSTQTAPSVALAQDSILESPALRSERRVDIRERGIQPESLPATADTLATENAASSPLPPAVESARRRKAERMKESENAQEAQRRSGISSDELDQPSGRPATNARDVRPNDGITAPTAEVAGVGNEPASAQRFQHVDFGEVEVTASQQGARRGKIRVAEVANPENIHYVKKATLRGRGNERMIPVREPDITPYLDPPQRPLDRVEQWSNALRDTNEFSHINELDPVVDAVRTGRITPEQAVETFKAMAEDREISPEKLPNRPPSEPAASRNKPLESIQSEGASTQATAPSLPATVKVDSQRQQREAAVESGGMLPNKIDAGTPAFFNDPAGARNRDGDQWVPVVLTGKEGTFQDGSRWVEVEASGGRGRALAANDIVLERPAEGTAVEPRSMRPSKEAETSETQRNLTDYKTAEGRNRMANRIVDRMREDLKAPLTDSEKVELETLREPAKKPAPESVLSQSLDVYGAGIEPVVNSILNNPKWKAEFLKELGEGAVALEREYGQPATFRTANGDLVTVRSTYKEPDATFVDGLSGIKVERVKGALLPPKGVEHPAQSNPRAYVPGKSAWEVVRGEWIGLQPKAYQEAVSLGHRIEVARAIREGKPVPEEVLKDYPEFQQRKETPNDASVDTAEAQKSTTYSSSGGGEKLSPSTTEKQPWEQTAQEFAVGQNRRAWESKFGAGGRNRYGETLEDYVRSLKPELGFLSKETKHRTAVEDALREGRPVPAEVLRDYPDLQKAQQPVSTTELNGKRYIRDNDGSWRREDGRKVAGRVERQLNEKVGVSPTGAKERPLTTIKEGDKLKDGSTVSKIWNDGTVWTIRGRSTSRQNFSYSPEELTKLGYRTEYSPEVATAEPSIVKAAPKPAARTLAEVDAALNESIPRGEFTFFEPKDKSERIGEIAETYKAVRKGRRWQIFKAASPENEFATALRGRSFEKEPIKVTDEAGLRQFVRDIQLNTKISGQRGEGRQSPEPQVNFTAQQQDAVNRFIRREVDIGSNDPRWEQGQSIGGIPNSQRRTVVQNNLAEILPPTSASVYHETSLDSARRLIPQLENRHSRAQRLDVSDNIDLALGQGGRGVVLEIDPRLVNGFEKHSKPMMEAVKATGGGSEYHLDATHSRAVKSIIVKTQRQLDALRKIQGLDTRFNFDAVEKVERGFRISRKRQTARLSEPSIVKAARERKSKRESEKQQGIEYRHSGIDPTPLIDDLTIRGWELYDQKVKPTFAEWSKRIREEFGEDSDPHLEAVWKSLDGEDVKGSGETPPGVRSLPETLDAANLPGGKERFYEVKSNVASEAAAKQIIKERGIDSATHWVQSGEKPSAEQSATAIELIRGLAKEAAAETNAELKEAKLQQAGELASNMSVRATEAGQFNQYFATLVKESPAGALYYAERAARRKNPDVGLVPELRKQVFETATKLKTAEDALANVQEQLDSLKSKSGRITITTKIRDWADRAEQDARARLAERAAVVETKRGERGASIIPADIADYAIIGAAKIARGTVNAAEWSKSMVDEFGEGIRPHLNQIRSESQRVYDEQLKTLRGQKLIDEIRSLGKEHDVEQRIIDEAEKFVQGKSRREFQRGAREKYGITPEEATELAAQSFKLYKEANSARHEQGRVNRALKDEPDATPERQQELIRQRDDLMRERGKERRELYKMLRTIEEGQPGAYRRVNNQFRGFVVSALGTMSRNLGTQSVRQGVESLTDAFELAIVRGKQKAGVTVKASDIDPNTRMLDTLKSSAYLLQRNKRITNSILDEFPGEHERMYRIVLSDIELPTHSKLQKSTSKVLDAVDKVVSVVTAPARFAEFAGRRAAFRGVLEARLAAKGIDLDQVVKEGRQAEISPKDIEAAVDSALRVTFAESPKYGSYSDMFVRFTSAAPAPINPLTFSRFMWNSGKFVMEYSPLSLVTGARKSLRGESGSRDYAKAAVGAVMQLTAVQVYDALHKDDSEWYLLQNPITGNEIDIRPYQPFSSFLFVAHWLRSKQKGEKVSYEANRLGNFGVYAEGLGGFTARPNPAYEAAQAAISDQDEDWSSVLKNLKRIGGETVAGVLTPLKNPKQLIAQFDKEEATIRNTRKEPFAGPIKNAVPFLGRSLPAVQGKSGDVVQPNPILQLGGIREIDAANKYTRAETYARQLRRRHFGEDTRNDEAIEDDLAAAELKRRARRGEDVSKEVDAMRSQLSSRKISNIRKAQNVPELRDNVHGLSAEEAVAVYRIANAKEKELLLDVLKDKLEKVDQMPEERARKVRALFDSIGIFSSNRLSRPTRQRNERPARQTRTYTQ